MLESLPQRGLKIEEIEALEKKEQIEGITPVLEFSGRVLSFVVGIDGTWYGLHCDHDTAEWERFVEGPDFETVLAEHRELLDEDIDQVNEELGTGF